mgnify:CR=1 FL=1
MKVICGNTGETYNYDYLIIYTKNIFPYISIDLFIH